MITSIFQHVLFFAASGPSFVPVRDPMSIDAYWLLLMLPLVVAIAVVYKTIKIESLSELPSQIVSLAVQIVLFMLLSAAMLWLTTQLI